MFETKKSDKDKNILPVLVVGCGISGATIAERLASRGLKVLIIDKRNYIGGNCYDFINKDGILVPKHGPHFFHTNSKEVWDYVSRFTDWHNYEHRVLSRVDKKLSVPVPVNIETVNRIFDTNIATEKEMEAWLEKNRKKIIEPKNSEESALNRVGAVLYEKLFKGYTIKQWDMRPDELDPSVMNRIPVRTNFDDRYFGDKFQGMPKKGYTEMFKKMLNNPNITVKLNTSFERYRNKLQLFGKVFFTGRIDDFFEKKNKKVLPYRSLRFKFKTLDVKYFQERAQINYPNFKKFTRIVEPKHATGQQHHKTTIIKEYPTWFGDPYYPVPNPKNQLIFLKYKREAEKLGKKYCFVGRLAEYKYLNMDEAFKNALEIAQKNV
jgi:UDP-galactopyranose mutase